MSKAKEIILAPSNYLLISIFLLAIFLRFLGVNPGFPPNHPDEPTIYGSVRQLILSGEFKPVLYSYGGLLYELYAIIIAALFIPLSFLGFLVSHLKEFMNSGVAGFIEEYRHSQLLSGQNFLYWTRYLNAFFGSLAVIAVYLLGKKLFGKSVGLVAAFLLAVNYRHVVSSVLVLADAPVSFFALLSIILSFNLIKNRSMKSYLLAGIGLGLSLSVKYFVYVIPFFFLCHLLSVFDRRNLALNKKIFLLFISKNLLLSLGIFAITFFIINPFIFLDSKNFLTEYSYDSQRFGVTSPISILLNYDYHRSLVGLYYLIRYAIGDWLSLAIIVGFFYSAIRGFKNTLILSFVIIPFLIVFLVIAAPSSARYYTAIMPLLLLFPSFLIIDILRFVKPKFLKITLTIVVIFALAAPSIKNSFLTALYFSWPQNQVLADKWLAENLSEESVVAVSAVSLPLTKNIKEIDINPAGATTLMSMEELKKNNAQWIVVSSFFTSSANAQAWINSNLVKEMFFNDDLFWKLINNTYISLTLNDVGAYRVKEFVKPFWQSPDRAIIIAKMPDFWKIRKDKLIYDYKFNNAKDRELFLKVSFIGEEELPSFSPEVGHDNFGSLYLESTECQAQTRFSSKSFSVDPGKWYSAIGFGKRESNPIYSGYKDGFLRLDFYSENNTKLKAYVSRLLESSEDWQELTLAGLSPADSKYGRLSFQLDKCFPGEKYFIDDLQIFSSDEVKSINIKEYPFYDKGVPENLLWLPEL
ncbi:MAG: glycosyltransferase family 39 protein [Candidatus Levybacteria bacterium]|nr:glycosyltransferase family 39 protein [Candidatus Levybacteria bacterium]